MRGASGAGIGKGDGGLTNNHDATTLNKTAEETTGTNTNGDGDLYVAPKGGGKETGSKGGKKGYGERWRCGEWGHPRRECPKFNGGKGGGSVGALKGGKYGTEGKGKHAKGYNGNGKGKATEVVIGHQVRQWAKD